MVNMPPKPEAYETRPTDELQREPTRELDRNADKGERKPERPGCDFSVLVNLGLL